MADGIYTVLTRARVPLEEARRICAGILGLPVLLLGELPPGPPEPGRRFALLEVERMPGEFPVRVDCSTEQEGPEEWAFAARFAREVRADCLTVEDTAHPFRYLLAEPGGRVRPVHVDIEDTPDGESFGAYRPCTAADPWCAPEPFCRTSRFPAESVLLLGRDDRGRRA
ncbi:hypothetical protein [Nocardiopsis composta]|uniref:Uncharacterized protein n=1 Tax=Nocardiopsis composta TaxID=157465 RepID=A0A7W8QII8_9ACTN|nr:hypothetical protein [Nocardiopsis composta]MBB5431128.1 hypothetical protein [Nocardiopsis composta]